MTDAEIMELFTPLYADLKGDEFSKKKPLLAHYTTIGTLEKILQNNEVWFSNPLFMNDLEEVRFGVIQGNELVMNSEEIPKACAAPDRARVFKEAFSYYFNEFANRHVVNTYVFCLSGHDRTDNDGRLSMWRGYGANGNGVAIVFDTAQVNFKEESPLIIAQVAYATTEARMAWLQKLISEFALILVGANVPHNKLHLPAHMLFERIKLFALFSKHHGFQEEREWRVVYMPDRDTAKVLEPMFHYSVGSRGVEPKLKFKVLPVEGLTTLDLSLTTITERIILGPTISSPMAHASVMRMLDILKHPGLKPKVVVSRIPFRPMSG